MQSIWTTFNQVDLSRLPRSLTSGVLQSHLRVRARRLFDTSGRNVRRWRRRFQIAERWWTSHTLDALVWALATVLAIGVAIAVTRL